MDYDSEDIGLLEASEEFYDGPLQVVTSGAAVCFAAAIGGIVYAIFQFVMSLIFNGLNKELNSFPADLVSAEGLKGIGFGLLASIVISLIVLTPLIYGTHMFARSHGKTDIRDYAIYGALAPVVAGLAMFVVRSFLPSNSSRRWS